MKSWVKFNANEYVRVRLTDAGRAEIHKQRDALAASFPYANFDLWPVEDAEGWSQWQLWDLMKRLGYMCDFFGPQAFGMEIELLMSTDSAK